MVSHGAPANICTAGDILITYVQGDLFTSPARVLVNPVNTVGTMGAGLAYDFKRYFPAMFEAYRQLCQDDHLTIGQLHLYRTPHKWVLNLPVKKHFRADAQLDHIETSLQKFASIYADLNITSASFPALHLDEPGLARQEVQALMEAYLEPLPISVYVHEPAVEERASGARATRNWLNTLPATLSFRRFWRDLAQLCARQPDWHSLVAEPAEDAPATKSRKGQTPAAGQRFRMVAMDASGRQRLSLKINPTSERPIYIPETLLVDLWQYIQRVGYASPHNFPGGLEVHGAYLVPVLAGLPYLNRILLTRGDQRVEGLHFIPPAMDRRHQHIIEMTTGSGA